LKNGSGNNKNQAKKIAALLSVVLWTSGFLLAFVIAPQSPFIWVPDLLLLLGFLPLLILWKPVWPWIVFGVLNVFIGFVLLVAANLPEKGLPVTVTQLRQHLADYHQPFVWMLLGLACIAYALGRIITGVIVWVIKSKSK